MAVEMVSFIPKVQTDVVGAPRPVVLDAIRDSVILFCEKTLIYKSTITITLVEGQREYTPSLPTGTVFVKPIRMRDDNGRLMTEVSEDWMDEVYYTWTLDEDTPTQYYLDETGNIHFAQTPREGDAGKEYSLVMAIKPSRVSTEAEASQVPDFIKEHWEEAIVHGAKAVLQSMRDKPWSSQRSAANHKTAFDNYVTKAKAKVMKSFTGVGRRTSYQKFGGKNA